MQTLGVYLKNGRESQNISLSDVADYTKISKIYLDCLENDEYTKFPAKPYVKGYISSYAACVGIDKHEAFKLYDTYENEKYDAEEIKPEILKNKKNSITPYLLGNKKFRLILAFCILSIIAIGAYYSFFQNQTEAPAKISLEEKNKALQPALISTIKPEPSQNRQDNDPFPSGKQTGFAEKIENREVGINQDNSISQAPAPPASHKPEGNTKEASHYPPINEVSKVKDLPGLKNNKTIVANNLMAIEVAVSSSIKNRLPQGIGNTFEWSTERIYIWNRIKGESPHSSIRHIYYFKGEKVSDVLLKVRSSHWRTWSYKTLSNTRYIGQWRVDVTSVDGKVLKSINFVVK